MSVKSRKRELALPVLLAACLLACLLIGGSFFTKYLQVKIYEERTTQLTEITSQVRVNLSNALDAHWSYLNTAVNALRHQRFASGEEMTAYIGTLERLLETESYSSMLMLLDEKGHCYDAEGRQDRKSVV